MSPDRKLPMSVQALSEASCEAFCAALGGLFEHSPWVLQRAWAARPFKDREALRGALCAAMYAAPPAQQLALIRAHPELAGPVARQGALTPASSAEQQGAGLQQCSAEEALQLAALNSAYLARFGFPFILAVRGHTRHSVIASLEARLARSAEDEFAEALRQIEAIVTARLAAWVAAD